MPPVKDAFNNADPALLLRWAAAYLTDTADMLERAHKDEYGRIRPAETRVEIKFLRAWIERTAELVPGAGEEGVRFEPAYPDLKLVK